MKFAILFLCVCVCVHNLPFGNFLMLKSLLAEGGDSCLKNEMQTLTKWVLNKRKEKLLKWSAVVVVVCRKYKYQNSYLPLLVFTFLLCDSFPLVIHRHNSVFFLLSLWLCPLQFYLFSMFFVYHPVPEILCFVWQSTTTPYVFVCFSRFPYRMIKREWQLSCFREQAFVISFPFPSFLSLVSCCKLPPPSSTWKCTHTHKEFEMLHKQAHTILFSTHMQMLFEHKQKHTNTMQVHEFHRNSCKHPLIQPCSGDLHIQQINIRRYTSTCKYNI